MKSHFVNYAFTTALYSEKRNFLDTFTPFVLKALYESDSVMTDQELRKFISDNYDLEIPVNTIKSILNGLSKNKLVKVNAKSRTEWEVCLNEEGKKEVVKFEDSESSVSRRQKKLIKSIQEYFETKGHKLNNEEIQNITIDFVQKNLNRLSIFNLDGSIDVEDNGGIIEGAALLLPQYFNLIQESEPELYQAYEELVKGSIIREHIANKEETEEQRKIESLQIYLDANVLFSLLEFHHPSINSAAKQLFKLLQEDPQIQIKAFSITLDEMARLLKSYKHKQDNYNPRIPVNTIFYYLKNKHFDDIKIDDLINNLDRHISELGIDLEELQIRTSDKLKGTDLELFRDVYSYKNQQNLSRFEDSRKEEESINLSALHDANIIAAIRRKRGGWVKSLERSKAVFLTSSFLMDHFCKQRYKLEGKFPEVILDLTLTNILWLRNPNKEIGIHLHKLISVHSKRFMVDSSIWNRFVNTLKTLHKEGDISKEQFATVFSSNQLTIEYLSNTKIQDISPETILNLTQNIESDFENKERQIELKTKKLDQKEQTLKKLEDEKIGLLQRVSESEAKQVEINIELKKLQNEREKDLFVDQKMDEFFYPLGKKFWRIIFGILIALIFMYFAEIATDSDFEYFRIPVSARKWIKFIGFLYPMIFTLINYKIFTCIFRFKFDNSSLRREFEKRFKTEFDNQNA